MNNYNPNIHHRRTIRLKGYDYSQAGLYFITICVKDRKCLFGEIFGADVVWVKNFQPPQEMILNAAGKIADEYWLDIPKHFPNVVLHEHIIMPNHVHGIIELKNIGTNNPGQSVGIQNFESLRQSRNKSGTSQNKLVPKQNEFQKMIPHSIGSIIRGYKIGVTKWFRNNTVGIQNFESQQSIWKRNFYEHIIRDEKSFQQISKYIINNPLNWP